MSATATATRTTHRPPTGLTDVDRALHTAALAIACGHVDPPPRVDIRHDHLAVETTYDHLAAVIALFPAGQLGEPVDDTCPISRGEHYIVVPCEARGHVGDVPFMVWAPHPLRLDEYQALLDGRAARKDAQRAAQRERLNALHIAVPRKPTHLMGANTEH